MFKRKLYQQMLDWKNTSNGRTALLIRGARRVGKSTIVEEFARREYASYILVDFSRAPREIDQLFSDMYDLDRFFLQLQFLYKTQLHERLSAIIFDEVQLQPLARQAIKHLVADGRYDYIETGSLISIRKNVKDIVIPSEETRINMYPLDYEEFRQALGDENTVPMLRDAFNRRMPLGDVANRKLLRDFRLYMLVGGMPQAVSEYLRSNNLSAVDQVKRNILELYEDDFRKIDPTGKTSLLFDAIPAELSRGATRYHVSRVAAGMRSAGAQTLIADMLDSMTVNAAFHANFPGTGMAMNRDLRRFKMYLADTGLFVTLAFKDKTFTENTIYQKLLSDKLSVNLGYLYENAVAQMLRSAGNELYYYTFPSESSNHSYEIDFLLARGSKVCPVEVKSSSYKTHASLDAFAEKFSAHTAERYLIYTKDLHKNGATLCMPAYMTMFLSQTPAKETPSSENRHTDKIAPLNESPKREAGQSREANHEANYEANHEAKETHDLLPNERMLLLLLAQEPWLSRKELCKRTELSASTIYRTIESLKKKNLLVREGSLRKGHWIVTAMPAKG